MDNVIFFHKQYLLKNNLLLFTPRRKVCEGFYFFIKKARKLTEKQGLIHQNT